MAEYLIDDTLMTAMANQISRINGTEETYNAAQIVDMLQRVEGTVTESSGVHTIQFLGPGETVVSEGNYDMGSVCSVPTKLSIPKEYVLTGFVSSPEVEVKNNYFIVPDSDVTLDIQYSTEDDVTIFEFKKNSGFECRLPAIDSYTKIIWETRRVDDDVYEWWDRTNYNDSTDPLTFYSTLARNYYVRAIVYGCTSIGASREGSAPRLFRIKLSKNVHTFNYAYSSIDSNPLSTFIAPPNGLQILSQGAIRKSQLTSLVLPKGLHTIETLAINANTLLTSLYIPSTVTNIANNAICNNESVNITISPHNTKYHSNGTCIIETNSKTIVAAASNCTIPDDGSVTSIGESCFYWDIYIKSIVIPKSIKNIGRYAFQGTELTSAIYQGTEEEWANVTVGTGNTPLTKVLTFAG